MSSSASLPLVSVGSVVADKFRVERLLASGGMGVVVAATHLQLDRPVALKFLRADTSANCDALARFTREARAAARLKSEHVARVLDVGVTDDGMPYMVMEYLEGLSLYRVLQTHGPLDVPSAAEYAIQACEGLAEAHARGIVHRDIKPDNLFLIERLPGWRSIKILDFGISKLALSDAHSITTGVIMGSPCYMSPEQLRATTAVDHRTDIWSLGATLHELLTGKPAFDPSFTLPELVAAILHKPPPPLRALRSDVPEGLAAIVARCMAKNRDARFDNAAELARALLKFAPQRARGPAERAASMTPAFPTSKQARGLTSARAPWQRRDDRRAVRRKGQVAVGVPSSGPVSSAVLKRLPAVMPAVRNAGSAVVAAWQARGPALMVWIGGALLVVGATVLSNLPPPPLPAAVLVAPPSDAPPSPLWEENDSHEPIDLLVHVSPESARITIDGEPVRGNPFHALYPRDDATHRIVATASGYEPRSQDVRLARDVAVEMRLQRHPAGLAHRSAVPAPEATMAAPSATATASASATVSATAIASAPPTTATPAPTASAVPAAAPRAETSPTALPELNPAGGRAPLRPIETKNPYE